MNEIENITTQLAIKDFELAAPQNWDQLKQQLSEKIVDLLIHNLPHLWNILYRIDVNEQKLKALFEQNNPTLIADGIAELALQRLKEKAITRIKYRS